VLSDKYFGNFNKSAQYLDRSLARFSLDFFYQYIVLPFLVFIYLLFHHPLYLMALAYKAISSLDPSSLLQLEILVKS
jgi:uncharacterized protein involved in cysteine biosynthesis